MNQRERAKRASLGGVILGGLLLLIAGAAIVRSAGSEMPDDEKQAIVDRLAATRAAAIEFASEHPELLPSANPTTMPTVEPTSWSVGIIEDAYLPGGGFRVSNMWSWDLGGNHVQVFAGSAGPNVAETGRGALVVHVMSMDLKAVPELGGSYKVPVGVGALRITSFEGTLLTIAADNGETFYFDADTRAFTAADGDPVPTDTPKPTVGPDSSPVASLTFPTDGEPAQTASAVPAPSGVAD